MDFYAWFDGSDYTAILYLILTLILLSTTLIRESIIRNKIGKLSHKVHLGLATQKYMRILIYVYSGFILFSALMAVFMSDLQFAYSQILNVIFFVALYYNSYRVGTLWFGEKALAVPGSAVVPRSKITNVKWDKDIQQKLWGINIYIADKAIPVRFYIPRKRKDEISSAFLKFNITMEESPF